MYIYIYDKVESHLSDSTTFARLDLNSSIVTDIEGKIANWSDTYSKKGDISKN